MSANNVLIVGPAWVGDMVMAQTLFKLLIEREPELVIDVLAPASTLPLLSRMPEVRKSILAPFKHGEFNWRGRYDLARSLREEKYQQAIILTNSFKSALVPFWARIPRRTSWLGEMRFGLLNDPRYLDKVKQPLMIQRFAALGLPKDASLPATLPFPALQISKESVAQALAKVGMAFPQKPVLALCPGAEFGPAKRWPASYYAKVAQAKLAEGWDVWLFGGPKDRPVAAEIQAAAGQACRDLTGQTSLTEAVDLLSLAHAVVSNDSGLMHVAAALKRPLVVIYGSSDPRFTPPLSQQVEILSLNLACSPCFKRECPLGHLQCLRDLSADRVLQAMVKLGV